MANPIESATCQESGCPHEAQNVRWEGADDLLLCNGCAAEFDSQVEYWRLWCTEHSADGQEESR